MAKTKKTTYRVRNWKEYNASLVRRGSLTVWVEEGIAKQWENHVKRGKPGASPKYSDLAIETMAMIGEVYHLTLRATEGLMLSIIALMKLSLDVPDYSTLCRRRKSLEIKLRCQG
jgi:hypothetical protein